VSWSLIDTFDTVAKRALRGERTNPCPGQRYYIVAVSPDGRNLPLPLTFASPEEAVLVLIRISPLLPGYLTFDIAVTTDGAEQ